MVIAANGWRRSCRKRSVTGPCPSLCFSGDPPGAHPGRLTFASIRSTLSPVIIGPPCPPSRDAVSSPFEPLSSRTIPRTFTEGMTQYMSEHAAFDRPDPRNGPDAPPRYWGRPQDGVSANTTIGGTRSVTWCCVGPGSAQLGLPTSHLPRSARPLAQYDKRIPYRRRYSASTATVSARGDHSPICLTILLMEAGGARLRDGRHRVRVPGRRPAARSGHRPTRRVRPTPGPPRRVAGRPHG